MSENLEQSSFRERLLTWSLETVLWMGTHIFKLNRLAAIEMVPLESTIQDALELYGEPDEVSVHDRHPDARLYIFSVGVFHQAIVTEWRGLVHAVSYWSDRSAPYHDLKCIMRRYGEEKKWKVLYPRRRKVPSELQRSSDCWSSDSRVQSSREERDISHRFGSTPRRFSCLTPRSSGPSPVPGSVR